MVPQELYETAYLDRRCPECGGGVEELDKDTSSGRDIRFLSCSACPWSDFVDVGIALWKAMSEANKNES